MCDWRGRGGVLLHEARFDRWHVDDNGMLQDASKHRRGSGLTKRVVDIVARQLRDSSSWGAGILQEATLQQLVLQLRDAGADRTESTLDLASGFVSGLAALGRALGCAGSSSEQPGWLCVAGTRTST